MSRKVKITIPPGVYNCLAGMADGEGITVSRMAARIVSDFCGAVMDEQYELNEWGGKREGAGNPNWKKDSE